MSARNDYRIMRGPDVAEGYECLVAPDGSDVTTLTEPEDRTFYRDLLPVLALLNKQHEALSALRAERDALRARVDAADAERDEALKVADVATDAAAKAVLDAKEVYEVRHLETIRRLKALLKEAGQVIAITTKTGYLAPREPGIVARIDKEIAP